ncbi:DUF1223 domain-containing protein [Rhodomicrobium vannielii ATCC 17100]|uniref:DUF1223 domain-containing protein n=1 Tax=Rhodomicrobium vannielii TaxID=1069 RepID=UPI00191938D3|nr:DUF1223 domain-containing protein [Rhodomicrobium vannielii]MBJ7534392.1 DUF1223 domain-containing protein [Rhodomicrobium vannielii ATCC 17100]
MTRLASVGQFFLMGALAVTCASGGKTRAAQPNEKTSVVELFSSQSCSLCPPAHRILQQLSHRSGIVVLSFPVNYWDYLGWKDTLARQEYGERQRNYAALLTKGEVFTPLAVVNGMRNCVGSDLAEIETAIKSTSTSLASQSVPLSVRREDGNLHIEVGDSSAPSRNRSGKLWVATVLRSRSEKIGAGDNAGQMVTYTNVVRRLTDAGDWQGAPASYSLPLDALSKDGDMLVVFLQTEKLGPILAATLVDISFNGN